MTIIKSMIIAFSMYSKIPMPQFAWEEKDMKYMLCFFPWVGAVIGAVVFGWRMLCAWLSIGEMAYTCIGCAIPLLITGGFHMDGFMDTMDAFSSYQPRERKLEILKDSHIGAFSVLMLLLYALLYGGAFSEISERSVLGIGCVAFALARALSGIAVVTFPAAKKDGLLYTFADTASRKIVKCSLFAQAILCIGLMIYLQPVAGAAAVIAALGTFGYYAYRSRKELGGITGDTAGYFVAVCECAVFLSLAVFQVIVNNR